MPETVIFAAAGAAFSWPLELVVQRFPLGTGTTPSVRRQLWIAFVAAATLGAFAWRFGVGLAILPAAVLTGLVLAGAAIDARHRIIPNRLTLPGALAVYALAVAADPSRWLELLVAALAAALLLGALWVVSPAGMGLGDVKLSLAIGACLGAHVVVALMVCFFAAAAYSLALIAVRGAAARKSTIAFGPFLAAGAIVALIFGAELMPAAF